MYNPDKWMVIKIINGEKTHYRVFATWSGGYTQGDSWKMNSGITGVTETDDHYFFKGSSGSTYKCNKEMYGATLYGIGVLKKYQEEVKTVDAEITILPEDTDWFEMDWLITERD